MIIVSIASSVKNVDEAKNLQKGDILMQEEFRIVPIDTNRITDLTNERYGRLVVLGLSDKGPRVNFVCQCNCGNKTIVRRDRLVNKRTTSCGCDREQVPKQVYKGNYTHGESKSKLYKIWVNMKYRCSNPDSSSYSQYGGRGIEVCREWEESYVAFAEWSRNNGYQDDLTLDRIDINGNYEESNCQWVSHMERNESNNLYIEHGNQIHTLSEWSRITGISRATLSARYHNRGDRGDRLFRPVRKYKAT